jgi:hypothetical protein
MEQPGLSEWPFAVDFRAVFVRGKSTACGANKTAGRQGSRETSVRWPVGWCGRAGFTFRALIPLGVG